MENKLKQRTKTFQSHHIKKETHREAPKEKGVKMTNSDYLDSKVRKNENKKIETIQTDGYEDQNSQYVFDNEFEQEDDEAVVIQQNPKIT